MSAYECILQFLHSLYNFIEVVIIVEHLKLSWKVEYYDALKAIMFSKCAMILLWEYTMAFCKYVTYHDER